VKAFIIDEADNLMEEPYVGEVETLFEATPLASSHFKQFKNDDSDGAALPQSRFICLASATSNAPSVTSFAQKYFRDGWQSVSSSDGAILPKTVTHALVSIPKGRALGMLKKVLHSEPLIRSAIIFVNDPYKVKCYLR
jgi:superfamily II DNA/RNA helicase